MSRPGDVGEIRMKQGFTAGEDHRLHSDMGQGGHEIAADGKKNSLVPPRLHPGLVEAVGAPACTFRGEDQEGGLHHDDLPPIRNRRASNRAWENSEAILKNSLPDAPEKTYFTVPAMSPVHGLPK